jgi:hypothetical protein
MKGVMYEDRIYFIKSIEYDKRLTNCCIVTLLLGKKLLVNYQNIIDLF